MGSEKAAAGEIRFDFSSEGMRFKWNRSDLPLRQRDGGREGSIGIEATLEGPEPGGVAAISPRRLLAITRPSRLA
jgi:hypothetical protein